MVFVPSESGRVAFWSAAHLSPLWCSGESTDNEDQSDRFAYVPFACRPRIRASAAPDLAGDRAGDRVLCDPQPDLGPDVAARASLVCRLLILTLAILAFAGLVRRGPSEQRFVVFATDVSRSVAGGGRQAAEQFIQSALQQQGGHEAAFIPFAGKPGAVATEPQFTAETLDVNSSDPAAALQLAAATIPADFVPQVVLLTDGNETRGDLARAALGVGVPVAVVPLPGFGPRGLRHGLDGASRGRSGRGRAVGSRDPIELGNEGRGGTAPRRRTRRTLRRSAAARREPDPPANAAGRGGGRRRHTGRHLHGASGGETGHDRREQSAPRASGCQPAFASSAGRRGTCRDRVVPRCAGLAGVRCDCPAARGTGGQTRRRWTLSTCWSSPTCRPRT